MKISELNKSSVPKVYLKDEFRACIESSLPFIASHTDTVTVTLTEKDKVDYERNFYSLLSKLGIKTQLHWVILKLAGLSHAQQDFSHLESITVPSTKPLEQLRQSFTNSGVISI